MNDGDLVYLIFMLMSALWFNEQRLGFKSARCSLPAPTLRVACHVVHRRKL
jgi:hypothetical protein